MSCESGYLRNIPKYGIKIFRYTRFGGATGLLYINGRKRTALDTAPDFSFPGMMEKLLRGVREVRSRGEAAGYQKV